MPSDAEDVCFEPNELDNFDGKTTFGEEHGRDEHVLNAIRRETGPSKKENWNEALFTYDSVIAWLRDGVHSGIHVVRWLGQ